MAGGLGTVAGFLRNYTAGGLGTVAGLFGTMAGGLGTTMTEDSEKICVLSDCRQYFCNF